ncbi:MAG: hypothetical protein MJ245_00185 [Clostridia bacterium]|nr:hypothetical protein [Clostridia bacterium]
MDMENENMMDNMNEEMEPAASANETKNEKFMRLAEFRVNKLMNAIASLDKLHNKSSYEYTEEQVNMMFNSIEEQLNQVKSNFTASKVQEAKFSFKSMM